MEQMRHIKHMDKENRSAIMAKILISDTNTNKSENGTVTKERYIDNNVVSIMCTHLDHMSEQCRLLQLNYFLNNIKTKNVYYPDIICGDFNSLLRSDYDKTKWNEIADIRNKSKWEDPKSELMYQLLVENDDIKTLYYDTFELVLKETYYEQIYLLNCKNEKDKMDFIDFCKNVNLAKWMKNNGDKKNSDENGNIFKNFSNQKINDKKMNENLLNDKLNKSFFEYF